MNWQKLVRELEMSRKDRIGILILSVLVILSIYLPSVFRGFSEKTIPERDTAWIAAIRELELKDSIAENKDQGTYSSYRYRGSAGRSQVIQPFEFDPNTLPEEGWLKLGLPARTARTIVNYISKGGRFREKEDLKKIYGIRAEQYEILEPYIRITVNPGQYTKNNEKKYPADRPVRSYSIVEINTADTSSFIALPGIGSKLAARIVAFREKLGGFCSIDQLKEVYGLADSVFGNIRQYLLLENGNVKKININTATEDELKAHPYIRFALARPIIAYRNSHGFFKTVEEIKKVMAVTNENFVKMRPYLSVE